jgi:hypothetical protein
MSTFTAPRRPVVLDQPEIDGIKRDTITAMMAITAKSSTRLKPRLEPNYGFSVLMVRVATCRSPLTLSKEFW